MFVSIVAEGNTLTLVVGISRKRGPVSPSLLTSATTLVVGLNTQERNWS